MARTIAALLTLAALPAAAAADSSSTCFDGPPLVASTVLAHLERYSKSVAYWDGKTPLPRTTYGRCKVKDATLLDPKGRRIARLHCGMTIERRGLVDHLGLQVGDSGARVIERSRPAPGDRMICTGYTGGSRCGYVAKNGDELRPGSYIVERELADGVQLTGAKAEAFLRGQRIDRLFITGGCH